MNYYKKRKKKSTKKRINKTPAGSQRPEADVTDIRNFELPLEEVMENISALTLDIERILEINDHEVVLFVGDTQGKPRDEAGCAWIMDETYCKENEIYTKDAEGNLRRVKPGDYGLVVWDMRQINLWTLFVVCHELRHIWQIENGLVDKWGSKELEIDADAFALCVSNVLYGVSMMHDKDDEFVAPGRSGSFFIKPDDVMKKAEMLDEEVRRAFKKVAMKKPLNIDNDRYVWKRLVAFDHTER